MLKFSMLLQAIDRVTGPAKRIRASMRDVGQGARKLAADLRHPNTAYKVGYVLGDRLRAGLGALVGGFRRAGLAARRYAGAAGLAAWKKGTDLAARGSLALAGKLGRMAGGAAKWAAAGATAASGFAVFDLFKTAAQFEQFQIMLENMEGSSAAAKRSLDWVKGFAQKTPYELADVMEAFVQLKAYGIDPMNGSLTAIGDAAAGMSKPVMQGVEAMADAITGEYERLKEFGIRASKSGDQVTFSWRKNGKDLTRTVKATGSEIEKALTGIFVDRFGGMMDRQSRTFAGMISNLKDSWSNFLMMVADAGVFDLVKGKLSSILAKVNEWAKNGQLKAWAEKVSAWLKKAFNWAVKFIEETDWQGVIADLRSIGAAAKVIADAVLSIARNWGLVSTAMKLANPITAGQFAMQKIYGSLPQPRPAARPGATRAPVRWPSGPAVAPQRYRLPAGPRKTAANDTQVGGTIRLRVDAAPGTKVRTASVDSANRRVPIVVDLGRSMAGAA